EIGGLAELGGCHVDAPDAVDSERAHVLTQMAVPDQVPGPEAGEAVRIDLSAGDLRGVRSHGVGAAVADLDATLLIDRLRPCEHVLARSRHRVAFVAPQRERALQRSDAVTGRG